MRAKIAAPITGLGLIIAFFASGAARVTGLIGMAALALAAIAFALPACAQDAGPYMGPVPNTALEAAGFVTAESVDPSLSAALDRIELTYTDGYKKQDASAIAEAFTADGLLLAPSPSGAVNAGTQAIARRYENIFKLGANNINITRSQLTQLGNDVAIAFGEYHVTGQGQSGPIKIDGDWSATYVYERDAGMWKIKLLNAIPKAPTPGSR